MNFWTPTQEWLSEEAFLIGGGPSLTYFDFNLLKGRNVIGCNDAYRLGPEVVKICVFGDASFWHRNKWDLENWSGRLVTNCPSLMAFKVPNLLKMKRIRDGIHGGDTLGWNYSSGALAINMAVSLGAKRIYLLGYDLTNQGSKSHWHNHTKAITHMASFKRFQNGFQMVRKCLPSDVKVINVTDGTSKLEGFEKIYFSDFYPLLKIQEAA